MSNPSVHEDAAVAGLLNQLRDNNLSSVVSEEAARDLINDYFLAPRSLDDEEGSTRSRSTTSHSHQLDSDEDGDGSEDDTSFHSEWDPLQSLQFEPGKNNYNFYLDLSLV